MKAMDWKQGGAVSGWTPVALSGEVEIQTDAEGFVSFSNSPYYSHVHSEAVDLYPSKGDLTAYSPLDGVVASLHIVRSPRPRYFQASETEDLLIIEPTQNTQTIARILHIDSSLSVGDKIFVGEPLGTLTRSGFFNFWTENHMHVELRNPAQPLRAKGSLPMVPLHLGENPRGMSCDHRPLLQIEDSNSCYVLARALEGEVSLGQFRGYGCEVNGNIGILDAGLPHYGRGGVLLGRDAEVEVGDEVVFWGTAVGEVVAVSEGLASFRTYPLVAEVNGKSIRGLSLYPWLSRPLLKLIPLEPTPEPLLIEEDKEFRITLYTLPQ